MFNVRIAGYHLYRKLLFTWLSLVMCLMVTLCAVFFQRYVLGQFLMFSLHILEIIILVNASSTEIDVRQ